jgi:rare lipoprotein A
MHSLGTHLVVKNIKNGKEVIVVVTDRIGKRFARTRIDLSKGAFEKIADLKEGLVKVSITEITD